jgi:hypothetical protein
MLNETIDNEPVYVCSTNSNYGRQILPFYNYNVRIYNYLQKFAAHLKPCGGTPVAEH